MPTAAARRASGVVEMSPHADGRPAIRWSGARRRKWLWTSEETGDSITIYTSMALPLEVLISRSCTRLSPEVCMYPLWMGESCWAFPVRRTTECPNRMLHHSPTSPRSRRWCSSHNLCSADKEGGSAASKSGHWGLKTVFSLRLFDL